MASIQCTKCKTGIRYHGEPEGVEYVFVRVKDWDKITSTSFDPLNKQYANESTIPKLFQSDTIESDFEELIIKAWKCPVCGSIVFFDRHGRVIGTYEERHGENTDEFDPDDTYVVFDDYSWNALTDLAIPNAKITKQFSPSIYAELNESRITFFMSNGDVKKIYKRVEAPSEQ